jgi:hypothetical protein
MPNFDDMFPRARGGLDAPDYWIEGVGSVWKCGHAMPCTTCRVPTEWIEICAESHFCSTECSRAFWEKLNEGSGPGPMPTEYDLEIDF